ncbi:Melanoma-Associated Antigen 11 [Manis pentadactyla]|nr:Melanoma-Associated Antigen 11 [Manis pentadactyla]
MKLPVSHTYVLIISSHFSFSNCLCKADAPVLKIIEYSFFLHFHGLPEKDLDIMILDQMTSLAPAQSSDTDSNDTLTQPTSPDLA